MIRFAYLKKQEKERAAKQLFSILEFNMTAIAPTGNTFEEDFAAWSAQVLPALEKPTRQIVCVYDNTDLIGFFQYYVHESLFMMEEIQFKKEYHSRHNLFRRLYAYVLPNLPSGIHTVEAYANKKTIKSQGILTHIGLHVVAEEERNLRYRGDFSDLTAWLCQAEENETK